ncbi:MAG: ribosomal L7Ae/L30e/S12e/Gadd45 family protein [Clostridia bacterium]|nr:ribosomal L7Ae/L30e/S12e/Gadd45 family protein [Clostridia bacterium]
MKYVGVKQVMKAVSEGIAKTVYVGDNAEQHILSPLIALCEEKGIEVKHVRTMEELGKLAGIDVKAAAAAE